MKMTRFIFVFGLAVIASLLLAPVASAQAQDDIVFHKSGPAQKAKCPTCGMFTGMFASWNAKITFKDSSQAVFDGAKCMFKYYLEVKKYDPSRSRDDIAQVSVKDYYSKEDIDARQAFYVIWSDTYGPMGHEPIPFGTEGDAKKFLEEHKGKQVLRFGEITPVLITSLDNPP